MSVLSWRIKSALLTKQIFLVTSLNFHNKWPIVLSCHPPELTIYYLENSERLRESVFFFAAYINTTCFQRKIKASHEDKIYD